jgi:glycosyltransferase involved in cell wall biosynthesis
MKFSIGIPAYKSLYLNECIESVLSQDYLDFELIIVNDFSPNPINIIIKNFNDNRIKYFENDFNIGAENVVDNWNKCLSLACGDYFILLGDDDLLENNYLSTFKFLIDKYPYIDIFHCRTKIIDDKSNPIEFTISLPEYETVYDAIMHRLFYQRLQFVSDFVYKTTALRNIGGYYKLPLAWCSDDLTAYIVASDKGIVHTNEPIFNYRRNDFSITSSGNNISKRLATLQLENWLKDFLFKPAKLTVDEINKKYILDRFEFWKLKNQTEFILNMLQSYNLKGYLLCHNSKNLYQLSSKNLRIQLFNYFFKSLKKSIKFIFEN